MSPADQIAQAIDRLAATVSMGIEAQVSAIEQLTRAIELLDEEELKWEE